MSNMLGDPGHALPQASSTTLKVVTFFAGGQRCAMEAQQVRALRTSSGEEKESCPAIDQLLGLPEHIKVECIISIGPPGEARQGLAADKL